MPLERDTWPELPYEAWRDTAATLHLWTQIAGKVRLSLTPWVNHSWQVPLYVSACGLTTSPVPAAGELIELEFDFLQHRLLARSSRGTQSGFALEPQTVADFYGRMRGVLQELGVAVTINERPAELRDAIPFPQDRSHGAYDAAAVQRFWRALVKIDTVLKLFRSGFLGKVSPTHFFWGSFDLAVTRFSGRRAPLHPGGIPGLADAVTREAYSHEVSSAGFWPGNDAFPRAAFYSYAWPEPPGFSTAAVPPGATYNTDLGEFILPYEQVRQAADPQALLLEFLTRTYEAAADNGHWDRAALECELGVPGRVRPLS
ncbi:MAG: hypothetical protein JO203_11595 [Gammaproteobacteria bacterium]|nr:hypothetical protein [Gammaproteobacteria bacterium]